MRYRALTLALGLMLAPLSAYAQPGIPHQFYGTVSYDSGTAPDGLVVEAKVSGAVVGSSVTNGGKYGINPSLLFASKSDGDWSGETAVFFVGGIDTGESHALVKGNYTKLDLTVPGSVGTITKTATDVITDTPVTITPTSPTIISMGDALDVTISSDSSVNATVNKVEKLASGFFIGATAVLAGQNLLNAYEIKITGTGLTISVTMKYSDTDIDESTVKPYKYNGSAWVEITPYTRNTTANTITYSIASASTPYVLFGSPATSGGGGSSGGGGGGSSSGGTNTNTATAAVTTAPTSVTTTTLTPSATPTTSAAPTAPVQGQVLGAAVYNFAQNLAVGSQGADVTALQQFLADNKFYTGPVTGYFGPLTKTAVMAFQKAHGIAQVGTVGPLTRAELSKSTAPAASEVKVLSTVPYNFTQNLAVGSRGADVTALQQYLLDNKFYASSVTGYYGQLTKKAVMAFQKVHGIAPVGNVGLLTRVELNKGVTAAGDVVSSVPSHSALTAEQVNSIITMIQAFGADAAIMAKVQAALAK
ncbi:MAG: peptidoglycan-binding protein [bacterium]|nr:peptidoglycan-binding protein [bacterium]